MNRKSGVYNCDLDIGLTCVLPTFPFTRSLKVAVNSFQNRFAHCQNIPEFHLFGNLGSLEYHDFPFLHMNEVGLSVCIINRATSGGVLWGGFYSVWRAV